MDFKTDIVCTVVVNQVLVHQYPMHLCNICNFGLIFCSFSSKLFCSFPDNFMSIVLNLTKL